MNIKSLMQISLPEIYTFNILIQYSAVSGKIITNENGNIHRSDRGRKNLYFLQKFKFKIKLFRRKMTIFGFYLVTFQILTLVLKFSICEGNSKIIY